MKKIRKFFKKILIADNTSHQLALGFAIGIFWAIMPTFGFAIFFSVPIAIFLKSNKITAILGTFIANPITTPFIYIFNYKVGSFILRLPFSSNILNLSKSFLLGSFVFAIFLSFVSYWVVLILIPKKHHPPIHL